MLCRNKKQNGLYCGQVLSYHINPAVSRFNCNNFRYTIYSSSLLSRRMKVFCDKIIVKREVTAQNTLRLRLKGNTLHAPLWFSPRFAASCRIAYKTFAAKLHPNPPLRENPHSEFYRLRLQKRGFASLDICTIKPVRRCYYHNIAVTTKPNQPAAARRFCRALS